MDPARSRLAAFWICFSETEIVSTVNPDLFEVLMYLRWPHVNLRLRTMPADREARPWLLPEALGREEGTRASPAWPIFSIGTRR